MTEKERVLAMVMEHFMDKAEKYRKSQDPQKIIGYLQWYAAAIETAGLGAGMKTIDKNVKRLMGSIKWPFLHFEYFNHAVTMAKQGASSGVVAGLLKFGLKHYCYIWALEDLTSLLNRNPTREEILALVRLEQKNQSSWTESLHRELVVLAKKHLSYEDVEKVQEMLQDKIREWRSHVDI